MLLKAQMENDTAFGKDGDYVKQLGVVCIICCARGNGFPYGNLSLTTYLMPVPKSVVSGLSI